MTASSRLRPFPQVRRARTAPGARATERGEVLSAQLKDTLLEEGPPTCIVDQDDAIVYANPGFERIKRSLAAIGALPAATAAADGAAGPLGAPRLSLEVAGEREIYRREIKELSQGPDKVVAFIYRPLTGDAKTQEALTEAKTRLEDVTRLVSDWVWETDRHFAISYVSSRVFDVLGYLPRELVGRPLESLIYDTPAGLRRVLDNDERSPFRNVEVKIAHKRGGWHSFRLSALPVYDPHNGTFLGLRGTAEDITALQAREEALIKAKEVAELANRAKTEFLANMSHELRTPLNAIIGFSEIMKQEILGALGNEQYLNYSSDIHASAEHLLRLINDILDIAKIEAGGHRLIEEEFHPRGIMESVGRLIAERCYRAGQRFTVDCEDSLPDLFADQRKIKQVLLNLLSNATKFTAEGGRIELSAALQEDGAFVFTVSDSGIGIAPEDMEKAFAPFEQVDSCLSRQYEGTGLGLPLSLGLMRLHGGTLELESDPRQGTKARAILPARRVLS
jgi:PAS domain S-box-containing protein